MTKRLIEEWLPIAVLGQESVRERTPMTPFPAPNRLHVWWARRPLVASRAAVLASLLPADADRDRFTHVLGIHGDPVAAKVRIAKATRDGIRLGADAYGYPRAFSYFRMMRTATGLATKSGASVSLSLWPSIHGGRRVHPFRDGTARFRRHLHRSQPRRGSHREGHGRVAASARPRCPE